MSREEYDKIDAVNWSTLKHMGASPAHYKHALANPPAQTPGMAFGLAAHCLVLEGSAEFKRRYVAQPGFGDLRSSKNRSKRDEWLASESREVLSSAFIAKAERILVAVMAHPVAEELVAGIKPEQFFTWIDEETGIKCKACQDGIGSGYQLSFKTTSAATPEQFARQYFNLQYHGQTAFYVDGYERAAGLALPEVIIAAQTSEPFDVWVLDVPELAVDEGRALYGLLLEQLAFCRSSDKWPGAVPTRQPLHVPGWAVQSLDDDLQDLDLEL